MLSLTVCRFSPAAECNYSGNVLTQPWPGHSVRLAELHELNITRQHWGIFCDACPAHCWTPEISAICVRCCCRGQASLSHDEAAGLSPMERFMMMGQDENPFQAPFEESQGETGLTAPLLPATQGALLTFVVQYALLWTVGPASSNLADPLPCTVLMPLYTTAD